MYWGNNILSDTSVCEGGIAILPVPANMFSMLSGHPIKNIHSKNMSKKLCAPFSRE